MAMQDDMQIVNNARIVDVQWRLLYQLSSKNLNKVFQPRFELTFVLLTSGDFKQGGAIEKVQWDGKRATLRLKKVKIECDHTELTHMLQKIRGACNALETMIKK